MSDLTESISDHHCTLVLTSVSSVLSARVTTLLLLSVGNRPNIVRLASRTAQRVTSKYTTQRRCRIMKLKENALVGIKLLKETVDVTFVLSNTIERLFS